MHAIASLDGGRIANDGGAIVIPADRIPAGEDRERTEAFKPRRSAAEARVRHMHLPARRGPKTTFDGDKLCADGGKAAADVESLECELQHLMCALPASELPTHDPEQLVREVVRTAAAHRNPHGKAGV